MEHRQRLLSALVGASRASFALVHGGDPRDGNGATLFDQIAGHPLGRGHRVRPRIAPSSASSAVCTVKSAGRMSVEIVPVERERHGRARAQSRAVRRDDGRPAGSGGVDEHLAAAVLLHERGGRDARDRAPRRARRSHGSPPPRPRPALVVDRHEDVHALRAAGLDRTCQAAVGQRLANQWATRDDRGKSSPSGGSRSSTSGSARSRSFGQAPASGGIRSARWFANHSSVRRSSHRRVATPRASTPRPTCGTVCTQSGVYLGTFFCMNGALPAHAPGSPKRPAREPGRSGRRPPSR